MTALEYLDYIITTHGMFLMGETEIPIQVSELHFLKQLIERGVLAKGDEA
jgi:phage antirepressor YoqD-like protein